MRSSYILISSLFVLLHLNCTAEEMASKFSSAVSQFSVKFLNELDKDKSVVSSPLSAKFLLALLALGTSGNSHEELLAALGLSDDDEIRQAYSNVATKLKSVSGVTLNVANKVYVMEGNYDLQPAIKEDAIKVFDAGIEKLNFAESDAAASHINTWVENITNKKIKDLLSPRDLDALTRLVLVNAIYFKGSWSKKFDALNTQNRTFFGINGQIEVPMMYKEDNYRYGESSELEAQLLELPYVGGEASMVVVLPNRVDGLNDVLKRLANGYDLMADIGQMSSTKVQVTIPKFKIETEINLNELLPKIGIKQIFDPSNSGLTKLLNAAEDLYVSKAVQKAFIEINEEGAEAAAATAIMVAMCTAFIGGPAPVKRFYANKPFLSIILLDKVPFFSALYRGE